VSFNAKAPLAALVTLVTGLAGVQSVAKGVPESLGHQVCAYVTLGGQRPFDKASGLRERELRYRVTFAYRVAGSEGAAEDKLADVVDALEVALYADRTLGGTVRSLEADFSAADDPRYTMVSGQEYREYPVVVTVKQQRNYP
jgi:hypothetical protein